MQWLEIAQVIDSAVCDRNDVVDLPTVPSWGGIPITIPVDERSAPVLSPVLWGRANNDLSLIPDRQFLFVRKVAARTIGAGLPPEKRYCCHTNYSDSGQAAQRSDAWPRQNAGLMDAGYASSLDELTADAPSSKLERHRCGCILGRDRCYQHLLGFFISRPSRKATIGIAPRCCVYQTA